MKHCRSSGFLLMEVALVLALTALIIGPLVQLMKSQQAQAELAMNQKTGPTLLESVEAFVLAQGRLPCPADTKNGAEARLNNRCTIVSGWVPSQSLGLPPQYDWNLTVATLSSAGPPASDALTADNPFALLNPQQLAEIVYSPITPTQGVGTGALPAIHICRQSAAHALPAITQAGCGAHDLYSPSAVLVLSPAQGGMNQNRSLQFFIQTELQYQNPVWLSFERLNWLWMQSGALSSNHN